MKPPLVHAPTAIAPAFKMLTGFFDSKIAAGTKFEPGQTIQCAWMWFKLSEDKNGQTCLLAPRTGAMPMDFIPDCSDALNLVLTQRYVCDSFELNGSPCNAAQSAIVIKDIAKCRDVFMNRTDPEEGHASGWYFGAGDSKLDVNQAENLELKSLWELACQFPMTRDFFLLSPGWQVVFEDHPVVLRDFERAAPLSGSYFAVRQKKAL